MDKNCFKAALEVFVSGAVALGLADVGLTPADISITLRDVADEVDKAADNDSCEGYPAKFGTDYPHG